MFEQVMARDDAAVRGFRLLSPAEVRQVNPAIRGEILAGAALQDSTRSSSRASPCRPCAPRSSPAATTGGAMRFLGGRTVTEIGPGYVVDHTNERHRAEVVVICPGAERQGPMAELLDRARCGRCSCR